MGDLNLLAEYFFLSAKVFSAKSPISALKPYQSIHDFDYQDPISASAIPSEQLKTHADSIVSHHDNSRGSQPIQRVGGASLHIAASFLEAHDAVQDVMQSRTAITSRSPSGGWSL